MVTSPLISTSSSKSSTLRPLDFETTLRAPQQYLKTRVYAEGLVEEASFLLAEYLASAPVHASVGFPEIVVPILGTVRRATKAAQKGRGKGKEVGVVKALVERVEESAKWVEEKRRGVSFGPEKMSEVERWESGVKIEETPLGKYVRVLRKTREKRRKLVEKVRYHLSIGVDFAGLTRVYLFRRERAKTRFLRKTRMHNSLTYLMLAGITL